MTKLVKKSAAKKSAGKAAVKAPVKGTAVKTDEEKRLARNEALRAWRKANREKVNAYMKEWREKREDKVTKAASKKATATKINRGGQA